MRLTRYHVPTLKEAPAEAEVTSHKLMMRAGMIRKLAAGIYTVLPIGLKVIRKIENIIREEMNRAALGHLSARLAVEAARHDLEAALEDIEYLTGERLGGT